MNILSYRNHRSYLADLLESAGNSLDHFSGKAGNIFSKAAIYKIIAQDRSGSFKSDYFVSLGSWIEFLLQQKLNQKSLTHLILIQIEEFVRCKIRDPDKALKSIKRLIKLNGYDEANPKILSPDGLIFAKIYDELPRSIQSKIVLEIKQDINLYLSSKRSGVKKKRLEKLLSKLSQ